MKGAREIIPLPDPSASLSRLLAVARKPAGVEHPTLGKRLGLQGLTSLFGLLLPFFDARHVLIVHGELYGEMVVASRIPAAGSS